MEANVDPADLILAARRRGPGALQALALSLDEQLVGDDVALDGAVLAWRAVRADGLYATLRRSLPEAQVPFASVWEVTRGSRDEVPLVLNRRPAA